MLRLACLLVLVTSVAAHAQRSPAVAELVADHSSVKPGQEFTVGVLITMRPKWHVYWKFPGEAGLPTGVKFSAPNVTFSDLRWPTPMTFEQAGKKLGFGYTNTVLLTAKAKAPADAKPGQTIAIAAEADWLCCEVECLPGSKKMTLKLMVTADAPIKSYQKLFDDWEKRLPVKDDAAPKLNAVIDNRTVTVTLPAGAQLFPAPPPEVRLTNLRLEKQGEQSLMRLEVTAQDGAPATIPAVIATDGRAFESALSIK